MELNQSKITNIPALSAIYFALLQCGYAYFPIERDQRHVDAIQNFMNCSSDLNFFSDVKQDSCEVYPYWPRAFILETACFYLNADCTDFADFESFHKCIMCADNISSAEKNVVLWEWIKEFPANLRNVLSDTCFQNYFLWEKHWIAEQNDKYREELQQLCQFIDVCTHRYHSPVTKLQIVINPIKCVYSADYHIHENHFIFSSGRFQLESIIHEFLHHVVHPFVLQEKDFIIGKNLRDLGIDDSYYLSGNDTGKLNAFEEYAVRRLTEDILQQKYPDDLSHYLCTIV